MKEGRKSSNTGHRTLPPLPPSLPPPSLLPLQGSSAASSRAQGRNTTLPSLPLSSFAASSAASAAAAAPPLPPAAAAAAAAAASPSSSSRSVAVGVSERGGRGTEEGRGKRCCSLRGSSSEGGREGGRVCEWRKGGGRGAAR